MQRDGDLHECVQQYAHESGIYHPKANRGLIEMELEATAVDSE
jgi:hypothetical protein